jgi:hypothetical protein
MNPKYLSLSIRLGTLAVVLSCSANLHAAIKPAARELNSPGSTQQGLQAASFNDSAEAGMLHRAYRILATGDHDYKGHRVKAMRSVEAAARLLGLDLKGDAKDHEAQALSDAKLREASGLISSVLDSTAVKDQKHITKHLKEAINQINIALSIK